MATPCASGGKTVPTLPLRMPSPCTERTSPLTTLVRDNNPRSGARLANRGARGTTPSAQLAAALHGAGGKTASTLPLRMPSPCTERAPPLTTLARDNNPWSGARLASREARGTTPAAQLAAALDAAGGKTAPCAPAPDAETWHRATVVAATPDGEQGLAVRFQGASPWLP